MKLWTATQACASRAFCAACRLRPAFREDLAAKGAVTAPDFACPHGITLENLPIPSAPGKKGACLTCAERAALARQAKQL